MTHPAKVELKKGINREYHQIAQFQGNWTAEESSCHHAPRDNYDLKDDDHLTFVPRSEKERAWPPSLSLSLSSRPVRRGPSYPPRRPCRSRPCSASWEVQLMRILISPRQLGRMAWRGLRRGPAVGPSASPLAPPLSLS